MTGGAICSLFAQRFHLSAAEHKTLLACGAAAGMTAIFGTPIAAILLAVEVLLFEWKPRSFVPVVVAVLVALVWRPLLVGTGRLFPFAGVVPPGAAPLLLALGVGIVVGLLAVVLSALLYRTFQSSANCLPRDIKVWSNPRSGTMGTSTTNWRNTSE